MYNPTPPAGFRARLIALMGVCLYGTLACLVYAVLLRLQYHRKSAEDRRRHSWFATRVDDYICLK